MKMPRLVTAAELQWTINRRLEELAPIANVYGSTVRPDVVGIVPLAVRRDVAAVVLGGSGASLIQVDATGALRVRRVDRQRITRTLVQAERVAGGTDMTTGELALAADVDCVHLMLSTANVANASIIDNIRLPVFVFGSRETSDGSTAHVTQHHMAWYNELVRINTQGVTLLTVDHYNSMSDARDVTVTVTYQTRLESSVIE
jgi:hypothetical protein